MTRLGVYLILGLAVSIPGLGWGQFSPPTAISSGSTYSDVQLARDTVNNFSFVFHNDQDIYFTSVLFDGGPEVIQLTVGQ